MTTLFNSIKEWQQFRNQNLFDNKTIGFVPTMGNLHAGHASLLTRSVAENDFTILSLFVNPTQFNDPQDLQNYPRTFAQDAELANQAGVDFIFAPNPEEIYADNYRYQVQENTLSQQFCGQFRPGHFNGMLTIVLKLLLLVKATHAYFGEKDFQQLQLVQGMVEAFFIETKIIACSIVRNAQGLALSSRNNLLSADEQQHALHFPKLLNSDLPIAEIKKQLIALGFSVDYIEDYQNRRLAAVRLGKIRLIDNIILKKEKIC